MLAITVFFAGLVYGGLGSRVQAKTHPQDESHHSLTSLAMFLVASNPELAAQSPRILPRTRSSTERSFAPLLELRGGASDAVKEKRTGISFTTNAEGGTLKRLGVRTKGPIKVYAVGEYSNDVFILKMSYGISASKMSNALADALKPRCSDENLVSEFKACLTKGLPNGAKKGTTLVFSTGGGKLTAKVNGKQVCAIASKDVANAFANIYRDKKAVCKLTAIE